MLRDALAQAALLLVGFVAPDIALAAAGLVLLGLLGAGVAVAVARIAAIDPATVLGGNR